VLLLVSELIIGRIALQNIDLLDAFLLVDHGCIKRHSSLLAEFGLFFQLEYENLKLLIQSLHVKLILISNLSILSLNHPQVTLSDLKLVFHLGILTVLLYPYVILFLSFFHEFPILFVLLYELCGTQFL